MSLAALRTATMRPATRRRGDVLLDAIFSATLDELAENGFAALSIERIAERAHTGKASIYRRWPQRLDLVIDALDHVMPNFDAPPDTGDIREDLLVVLRQVAANMSSPAGCAAKACMDSPEGELAIAVRERLIPPRKAMMLEILQRGVERGQVRPEAVTPRIAETGPMLLHGELIQRGPPITDEAVVAIVDEVLMPLLRP